MLDQKWKELEGLCEELARARNHYYDLAECDKEAFLSQEEKLSEQKRGIEEEIIHKVMTACSWIFDFKENRYMNERQYLGELYEVRRYEEQLRTGNF